MAVSVDTLVERSVKRMGSGIHPVVKETAVEVIKRAYKEGIYVQISDGYRSNAEQQRLFNQGRTTPGNIVTNARPGQSLHNYGLAVDYFLVSDDGSKALWMVNDKWRRVAAIAKSLGFEWGGDWKGFVDYPHLQMTGGLSLAQLQAGKKPNLKSKSGNSTPTPSKPAAKPSEPVGTKSKWNKKTGNWTGQNLRQWDCGNPVKQLQTKLSNNKPPFYPEKGAKNNGIDSYFGANTKDAVRRFQSYYGLAVDGIAGKKTYEKLNGKKTSSKPTPKKTSQKVYLPKTSSSWRVYPTNKAPVKGNEKGFLRPSKFGGLTYEVLAKPQANVVTIKTSDFGRVNIYVHPSTGAVIK